MNGLFMFQFSIDGKPIFEREGEYFYGNHVDAALLAFGLCTKDAEGFTPVSNMTDYQEIQKLITLNNNLNKLSIVNVSKGRTTVVIDVSGKYQYFITRLRPEKVNDNLSCVMLNDLKPDLESSLCEPHLIEFA